MSRTKQRIRHLPHSKKGGGREIFDCVYMQFKSPDGSHSVALVLGLTQVW